MLEILVTAGIVAGVVAGVFVGLVALMLFMVGVIATTLSVINWLTGPRKVRQPPENQIEEAYRAYLQQIRDTAVYGAPIFGVTKKKNED